MPEKKPITFFMLLMINIVAIASVRNWPMFAGYGLEAIICLALGGVLFFIPSALVSAQLTENCSQAGGVYGWCSEAFGKPIGFLATWLQWMQNMSWYPAILTFIANTLAYLFAPTLVENSTYTILMTWGLFWGIITLTFFSAFFSGLLSEFGALFSFFIPGSLIIILGVFSWVQNPEILTSLDVTKIQVEPLSRLATLFSIILLSLSGIEMSANYIPLLPNGRYVYPKVIYLSVTIILSITSLGTLSILTTVPLQTINVITGNLQALQLFLSKYHFESALPFVAFCIALGGIGAVSTWIIGPSYGLLSAAEDLKFPSWITYKNPKGIPQSIVLMQTIFVTLFSLIYLFFPSIKDAYIMLSIICAQTYLSMYLLLFAAFLRLRYRALQPSTPPSIKEQYWPYGGYLIGLSGLFTVTLALIGSWLPVRHLQSSMQIAFLALITITIYVTPFLMVFLNQRRKKLDKLK